MSWSKDQKLVSLAVTGLLALQMPASAETSEALASKQDNKSATAPPSSSAPAPSQAGEDQTITPQTWETLTARGEERRSAGDTRGAEKLFNQSYELAKTFDSNDSRRPQAAENLAELFEREARYASAQAMYQEAFDSRQTAYGEGSPRLSKSYYNIGRVQMLAGDYSTARTNLKKALDLRQFSSSEEANQEDLALILILFNLGVLETETGNFDKAQEYLDRSQSIAQHLAKHKENAKIFSQLALLSLANGEFQKAEHEASTALSMAEKFAKGDKLVKAQALDSVAMVQLARRDLKAATDSCNQAWTLKSEELGLQHPLTANSLLTAALIKIAEKKYDAAEKTFNDAIAVYNQPNNESHLNYSHALMGRAFVNLKQKDKNASAQELEKALSFMTSTQGVSSHLSAKYSELYTTHSGPNLFEMVTKIGQAPNAVSIEKFDVFGQLLEIAVDDGTSDEVFAGMKTKDLFAILGAGFVLIVFITMAVLMPAAFSRIFPWGRKADDDHATLRNKNRNKQSAGQNNSENNRQQSPQPSPQSTLRGSTETERRQVQLWKNRLDTMEKELPKSNVKNSGAYNRIDFKPSQDSAPISMQQNLSTPVQPEGSTDQYW